MHAAPSVSYPVGRSAFAARLYAANAAAGLLACAAWALSSPFGWRQAAALGAVLAAAALALHGWRSSPTGTLHWDGAGWRWEEGGAAVPGRPEIALDLQATLLLRWQPDDGPVRWLWPERASDASRWDALRRAVYSRASTHGAAAGQPPAAER
jgi:hypothetical protein